MMFIDFLVKEMQLIVYIRRNFVIFCVYFCEMQGKEYELVNQLAVLLRKNGNQSKYRFDH